jgi:hypothetical protein
MRWTLACKSPSAPAGLAYFTGAMTLVSTDDGVALVAATGFFQADAFIFPSLAMAQAYAGLCDKLGIGGAGFMALPYLAAEAASAPPLTEASEVAP